MSLQLRLFDALCAVYNNPAPLRILAFQVCGQVPRDVAWDGSIQSVAFDFVHSQWVSKFLEDVARRVCQQWDRGTFAQVDALYAALEALEGGAGDAERELFVGKTPLLNRTETREKLNQLLESKFNRGIFVISGERGTGKSFTHRCIEVETDPDAMHLYVRLEEHAHRGPSGIVRYLASRLGANVDDKRLGQPEDQSTSTVNRWLLDLVGIELSRLLNRIAGTKWVYLDRRADSAVPFEIELFVEHVAKAISDGALKDTYLVITGLPPDAALPPGCYDLTLREQLDHVTSTDVEQFYMEYTGTKELLADPEARGEAVSKVMEAAEDDGSSRTESIANAVRDSLIKLGVMP